MIRTAIPILTVATLLAACTTPEADPSTATDTATCHPDAVWAVDLVRTLPGMQDTYLRTIEENWGGARALVQEHGHILSYRALAAAPDSIRGWDVILMTEYVDSTAFQNRESIFQAVFDSPEFVAWQAPVPSAEMRSFTAGEVTLGNVVSSGCHPS
ncbi:MAG: hypothetical protein RIE53_00600 [Rhodothermales bacterium]